MSRPPVYVKIDNIEIESPEQLVKFADNATHQVEAIFYGKFLEHVEHYKTHLYIGKIRFLENLMIIDAEEEQNEIGISNDKPVKTDFHLLYENYYWRGGISMQLRADVNLEEKLKIHIEA